MRLELTDGFLRAIDPPASGRAEYTDVRCAGLQFRITSAGVRSWSFRYRAKGTGKLSRATIGAYPGISLAKARLQANDLRKRVDGGENPGEMSRQTRRDAPGRTFKALSDRYIKEYAKRHKKSGSEDERNLNLHVLPKWKDRDFSAIRRRDVIDLLEGLITAGKPVLANRIQSLISGVFSFAIDADLRDDNPCSRLKKRGEETPGQRVLDDPEIRLFWSRVIASPLAPNTGHGLRLALLTGVRIGEVAGYDPKEFQDLDNPDKALWSIPANRTKNGRAHLVPLSPLAVETVKAIERPVTPHAYAKAMNRLSEKLEGKSPDIKSWLADPPTPHDLRRTVRTRLPQLGISREVSDRIMNHAPGDVGGKHYDRYSYLDEKRAALTAWADSLASILGAS